MKRMTIEEIREVELQTLIEIDQFCKNNNLRYILSYGTLIGAIRHNGFIPWDDDIDIAMPREDYDFFVRNYSSKNSKIISCETDNKYVFSFAKVYNTETLKKEKMNYRGMEAIGIDVDVFPVDYYYSESYPTSILKKWKHLKNRWTLNVISKNAQNSFFKKIVVLFLNVAFRANMNKLSKKINELVQEKNNGLTPIGFLTGSCVDVELLTYNLSLFDNITNHSFEKHMFCVPSCYDYFLRRIYGDYMELPPESERETHHNFEAYWLEK